MSETGNRIRILEQELSQARRVIGLKNERIRFLDSAVLRLKEKVALLKRLSEKKIIAPDVPE